MSGERSKVVSLVIQGAAVIWAPRVRKSCLSVIFHSKLIINIITSSFCCKEPFLCSQFFQHQRLLLHPRSHLCQSRSWGKAVSSFCSCGWKLPPEVGGSSTDTHTVPEHDAELSWMSTWPYPFTNILKCAMCCDWVTCPSRYFDLQACAGLVSSVSSRNKSIEFLLGKETTTKSHKNKRMGLA